MSIGAWIANLAPAVGLLIGAAAAYLVVARMHRRPAAQVKEPRVIDVSAE
jgi:hypothetical protein